MAGLAGSAPGRVPYVDICHGTPTRYYDMSDRYVDIEVQTDLSIAPGYAAVPVTPAALGQLSGRAFCLAENHALADASFRAAKGIWSAFELAFVRHEPSDAAVISSAPLGGIRPLRSSDGARQRYASPRQEDHGHSTSISEARGLGGLARRRGHAGGYGDGTDSATEVAASTTRQVWLSCTSASSQAQRAIFAQLISVGVEAPLSPELTSDSYTVHLVATLAAVSVAPEARADPMRRWATYTERPPESGGHVAVWRTAGTSLELPGHDLRGRLGAGGIPASATAPSGHVPMRLSGVHARYGDDDDGIRLQHLQGAQSDIGELRLVGQRSHPVSGDRAHLRDGWQEPQREKQRIRTPPVQRKASAAMQTVDGAKKVKKAAVLKLAQPRGPPPPWRCPAASSTTSTTTSSAVANPPWAPARPSDGPRLTTTPPPWTKTAKKNPLRLDELVGSSGPTLPDGKGVMLHLFVSTPLCACEAGYDASMRSLQVFAPPRMAG